MQSFTCSNCGRDAFFDNRVCLGCGSELGFEPDRFAMQALTPATGDAGRQAIGGEQAHRPFKLCANARHGACNWLLPVNAERTLCRACALNRAIPDLSEPDQLMAWRAIEAAKKRLVYSLLRFGLGVDGCPPATPPLTFDVIRHAVTGHLDGVVTIDVAEADAVERERRRERFDEPYRSLLGHLRHESGHYYWTIVVEQAGLIAEFRGLFGDERDDYAAALARHHAHGPPGDWHRSCVSAYASAHPWEDWAETWAHYLHIVETVDTAAATGMEPRAKGLAQGAAWPFGRTDIYRDATLEMLMERWFPLTAALNELSRSMGHTDFYPFVTPAEAMPKFAFVHRAIRNAAIA